jgi:DNA (cytosine-5)-methyltransferase 1
MLTFGSLFAGIGGIDLGLERAGMQCAWQVEWNDFAIKVLSKHWPDVPRFRDVRDCGGHNLPAVDLVCGGFPCQDISYAGLGAGITGERSGLWFEFARIICELEPKYVLVENVAALLDRGMGDVLGSLASIGYDAEWYCLPASAFGAPHYRQRIFILAHTKGILGNGSANDRICSITRSGTTGEPGRQNFGVLPLGSDWTLHQPRICREDDGIPHRVDRLRGLGNAVVPQVAEFIGRAIVAHHAAMGVGMRQGV